MNRLALRRFAHTTLFRSPKNRRRRSLGGEQLEAKRLLATVSDFVFEDTNNNTVFDAAENPFSGVTVDLIADANGNGQLDAGDTSLDQVQTAADGSYTFLNVAPGSYLIEVDQSTGGLAGLTLTTPPEPRPLTVSGIAGNASEFNFNGDLSGTGPGALDYLNGGSSQNAVQFGTATSFLDPVTGNPLPALADGDPTAMFFDFSTSEQGLLLATGVGANGGGNFINNYSLIFDVYIPADNWQAFYQTDPSPQFDVVPDAEFFMNPGRGIGIGGQYDGTLTAGAWNRVGVTLESTTPGDPANSPIMMNKYIDGNLVGTQQVATGVDGRFPFFIDNSPTGDPNNGLLFHDDTGDQQRAFVANFAFTDVPLSPAEMASFGGPSAAGIANRPVAGGSFGYAAFSTMLPPVIDAGADQTVLTGDFVLLPPASFTDPDSGSHTAQVDWGDGAIETLPVDQIPNLISGTHIYGGAGNFTVTVSVTDDTSNTSTDTFTVTVVDPTVVNSLTPADESIDVPINTDLTIELNQNVKKGNGNLYILRSADDSLAQTIDINSPAVSISGGTVTVNVPQLLAENTGYYVLVEEGALLDTATNLVNAPLMTETFDRLALGPFVSATEGGGDGTDWTAEVPLGWSRNNGTSPNTGPAEFFGLTVMGLDSWVATAGDQARSEFTLASGNVLVGDGDEYNDNTTVTHPADSYNFLLSTKPLNLEPVAANSVTLEFDSHWRPFDAQTGLVDVSYDGGTTWSNLLTYNTQNTDDTAFRNQHVTLDVNNPDSGSMRFRFGYTNADNDWYWGIDNVTVRADVVGNPVPPIASPGDWNFTTGAAVLGILSAGGDQTAEETQTVLLEPATFSDPNSDSHTATIDWGDGTVDTASVDQLADTISGSHAYQEDGIYTVTVSLTNDLAETLTDTLTVTVSNLVPLVEAGGDRVVPSTLPLTIDATFEDGADDTHTATIDWGDGTVETVAVDELAQSLTGSHAYAAVGDYTVTVTVTDDEGAAGSDTFNVLIDAPPLGLSLTPADDSTGVEVDANLTIEFDQPVLPGAGVIELHRSDNGAVVESITTGGGLLGVWNFTDSLANDIGTASTMTLNGANPISYEDATIGGEIARVARVPAFADPAESLSVTNPVGGNGGGAFTNEFTLAYDINFLTFPDSGGFASLLNTNEGNGNDVDWFVRADGNIDLGAPQIASGIQSNTWYRLVITNRMVGGVSTAAVYLDGVKLGEGTNGGVDGTISLGDLFHIFADENGETIEQLVNSVAFFAGAASDSVVAEMGAAAAAGISLPSGLAFGGNSVTINPTHDLLEATGYYVTIGEGAIVDELGHSFAGITDPAAWNFSTSGTLLQTIEAGADQTTVEGTEITLDPATFTDPNSSSHTAEIDWGDGTIEAGLVNNGTGTVSATHAFADNGTFTVTVTVTNSVSESFSDTFTVTVDNLTPTIEVGPDQTLGIVNAVEFSGAITDASGDSHTVSIDWGDGTIEAAAVDQANDLATGSHVYAAVGDYTVVVTVTDDDGASSSDSFLASLRALGSIATNPVNEATGVPVDADLSIQFSADVRVGNGNLYIKQYADDLLVATVNVNDPAVTIVGDTLTLDLPGDLSEGTRYYVLIDEGAILDTSATASFGAPLLLENFDMLPLMASTNFLENGQPTNDWTDVPPLGWTRDNTTTPAGAEPEYFGWSFADAEQWRTRIDQDRSDFTLASGTLLVADADEYDGVGGGGPDNINTFLTTNEIDLTGVAANSVAFDLDSSWRPFDNQTGTIDVSFDSGINWINLLTYNTGNTDDVTQRNEHITLPVSNPDNGTMMFRFGLTNADNDWWWAVDNIEAHGDVTGNVFGGINNKDTWNFTTLSTVNEPPTVVAGADQTASEGDTVSLEPATFTDLDSATHSATIDWGDGTALDTATIDQALDTVTGGHAYADNGAYTVTVTVTDESLNAATDTFTVTVDNAAPTMDAGSDASISLGSPFDLLATFADAGSADTHAATIDWGDTASDAATIDQAAGEASGSHTYATAGEYIVTVTVTDDEGDSSTDTLTVTVVAPIQITSLSPADDATGVTINTDLQVQFDSPIQLAGGTIELRRASDDSLVQSFAATAELAGLWNFDDNFDNTSAGGSVLSANGIQPVVFEDATIGGAPARVAHVPLFTTSGNHIAITNPLGPNGGGSFTNEFSFVFDVNFLDFPGTGSFASLLNTNASNSNDVDWFVRSNGNIDVGTPDLAAGIQADTWYRIAVVSSESGGQNHTAVYVDGVLIGEGTNGSRDGVNSLEGTVILFADNDGETVDQLVNSVAFFGGVLTSGEVAAMGAASAGGITFPEGLRISGDTLTIDPAVNLDPGVEYYVTIDGSAIESTDGVPFAGTTAATDWSFTTAAGNQPPTVNAGADQNAMAADTVSLLATFADADRADTHTATIDWGDGTIDDPASLDQAAGEISGTHVYATAGIYTVTVSVDDGSIIVSDTLTVNVEAVPVVVSLTPADDATNVPINTNLSVQFSEAVLQAGGNVELHRADDGSLVELFPLNATAPAGVWNFDDNLDNSTGGGSALTVNGGPALTYEDATIGGQAARVARLPALNGGDGENVAITSALGANGGGSFTNNFTLIYDVNFSGFPAGSGFASLLNTNESNANDVDWYISGSNSAVDLGAGSVDGSVLQADTWHRLVVVNQATGGGVSSASLYIDGAFLGSVNNSVDGTISLGSTFYIFSDDGADTVETLVNSVAYLDGPLNAAQVAQLGGPTAEGIVLPAAGITLAGDTLTLDPAANLDPSTEYYVTIDSTALADSAGLAFAGISDSAAWNFTTAAPNDDPLVTAAADQTLDEGQALTSFQVAAFLDSPADTHTATIDWGDGSPLDTAATIDQLADTVTASHTFADNGVYTVTVTVNDGIASGTDTFTVTVNNVAPTVNLTGPASIGEGSAYPLNLGAVIDPGADTAGQLIVDWGDGTTTAYTSTGVVSHTYDDGPASYQISVDLIDEDGTYTAVDTLPVTVNNVPPTPVITGPSSGSPGDTLSFTFSASEPSTEDSAEITYEIDWENDGTVDLTQVAPAAGFSLVRTFPDEGSFTIGLTTTDNDGGSQSTTRLVTIAENLDPVLVVDGELIVNGTPASDRIVLTSANGPGQIYVRMNNIFYGPFSVTRATVNGRAGSDSVVAVTQLPVQLQGGDGNDYLAGSSQDDVLLGGAGNDVMLGGEGNNILDGEAGNDRLETRTGVDTLSGGEGNDRLNGGDGNDLLDGGNGNDLVFGAGGDDLIRGGSGIDNLNGDLGDDIILGGDHADQIFGRQGHDLIAGGQGSDRLTGSSGDDLLIGGSTAYDDNDAALRSLLAEWISGGMTAIDSGGFPLNSATVSNDSASDELRGDTGIDWFLQNGLDRPRDYRAEDLLSML